MNAFYEYITTKYTLEELQGISHYGCSLGVHGMISYCETRDIFQKHGEDILEIIQELEGCLGDRIVDFSSVDAMYNSMVWIATEEVAYRFVETLDEQINP
jgi:hypothetical protein